MDISGNARNVFRGSIDYCVELAETYGGAVKLSSMFGVSWMDNSAVALQSSREHCCSLLRKPCIYLIHSGSTMFL